MYGAWIGEKQSGDSRKLRLGRYEVVVVAICRTPRRPRARFHHAAGPCLSRIWRRHTLSEYGEMVSVKLACLRFRPCGGHLSVLIRASSGARSKRHRQLCRPQVARCPSTPAHKTRAVKRCQRLENHDRLATRSLAPIAGGPPRSRGEVTRVNTPGSSETHVGVHGQKPWRSSLILDGCFRALHARA